MERKRAEHATKRAVREAESEANSRERAKQKTERGEQKADRQRPTEISGRDAKRLPGAGSGAKNGAGSVKQRDKPLVDVFSIGWPACIDTSAAAPSAHMYGAVPRAFALPRRCCCCWAAADIAADSGQQKATRIAGGGERKHGKRSGK